MKQGVQPWFPEVSGSRSMRTRYVDGEWVKPDAMRDDYRPRQTAEHMREYAIRKEPRATGNLSAVTGLDLPFKSDGTCEECGVYYGHKSGCRRIG